MAHLEDLRVVVFRIVITLLISVIICFALQERLMNILREPAEQVMLTKQQATMPDAKKHQGIRVPSVEKWNEAKDIEFTAAGLDPEQRVKFYKDLGDTELEFHARSVALLRAAKVIPEEKRSNFIENLKVGKEMTLQLTALLESNPNTERSADSNIRMMSALKPTETFLLSMKLAFFAGIVLAFPLLLMYILQFILPGLHAHERKVLWPAMAVGFGLFLGGVLFAYFLVLPKALLFFYEWSGDLGVSNDWRIGEYITFATQFTLLFGLSFELPVVIMVLVKLGLLTYDTMARTRTYAIVAIYVAAALITPTPDIMTLNLMAIPMLILYEICIWLAYFDRKKQREREAKEEQENLDYRLKRSREMKERGDSSPYEYNCDDVEDIEEHGDDGWHDDYNHNFHENDLESHEDWVEPNNAVTGDGDLPKDDEPKKED